MDTEEKTMRRCSVFSWLIVVAVACGLAQGCTSTSEPENPVALEAMQRDMIERMLREIDAGDADVYLDQSLFSPDFVLHLPGTAEPIRGAQAMRDLAAAHLKSLPNMKHEVLNFFPGPEVVVVRHNTTFDHTVDYFGAAPTGKSISETAIWVLRMQNGVFVEMWAEYDGYGSGVQMGLCTPLSEG